MRERTSSHPRRRPARKGSCPAETASGIAAAAGSAPTRIRARHRALTTKVAASTAIASPEPAETTSTPASTGPATLAVLRVSASRPLASCRRAWLTVCGISPISAGMKTAAAVP